MAAPGRSATVDRTLSPRSPRRGGQLPEAVAEGCEPSGNNKFQSRRCIRAAERTHCSGGSMLFRPIGSTRRGGLIVSTILGSRRRLHQCTGVGVRQRTPKCVKRNGTPRMLSIAIAHLHERQQSRCKWCVGSCQRPPHRRRYHRNTSLSPGSPSSAADGPPAPNGNRAS